MKQYLDLLARAYNSGINKANGTDKQDPSFEA